MTIKKIDTEQNKADMLTKNLGLMEFLLARWSIGIKSSEEEDEDDDL